jgi:hypothetical protein
VANTLTAITPSIYAGLDVVSRELIGFIPNVQRDISIERAAVGQTVTVPIVPAASGGNVTPASIPPNDGDVIITSLPVLIAKSKYSPIRWAGEEQLLVGPTGQYNKVLSDQFAQAFRWLANQIEVDLGTAAAIGASRAYGTAGTTPFGTAGDLSDFAGPNKILDDNGAPLSERKFIAGTAAKFNLEAKQSVLFKVNESGTNEFLRRRMVGQVMGFDIGTSAGVQTLASSGATGYVVNNSGGYPAKTTSITISTGTGTMTPGDIISFAGDTNQYVVASATTTNVTLNTPGLMQAVANSAAITVKAAHVANVAYTPNALVLAARAPALPTGGDSADDRMMVTDPVSGLSFEVSLYREYRRIRYEVAMAWGANVTKSDDIALELG